MKLYREVETNLRRNSFIVIHDEHKYSMILEPIEITEEEIDKLWYKYAAYENDFGNLFLGRDAYDLLMDVLLSKLKGE